MSLSRTLGGAPIRLPMRVGHMPARAKRNGFAIHAYLGANGAGKTMAAVLDSLPSLAAGRPIVSTCRILDPTTGEPHPLWVPLDDYRILLLDGFGYCDVIADEITGAMGARDHQSLPSAVNNAIKQLRKDDVTFRWTTPDWGSADVSLRRVTQAVTVGRGFMPVTVRETTADGLERRWMKRRLHLWQTYDAQNFEEFNADRTRQSAQKSRRLKPVARQLFWGPGSIVHDVYDTYEHALTLGAVSEAGLCMTCGGKRRAKPCACEPDAPQPAPSAGMLRWATVDRGRRRPVQAEEFPVAGASSTDETANRPVGGHRAAAGMLDRLRRSRRVVVPETDDTPSVVVELPDSA